MIPKIDEKLKIKMCISTTIKQPYYIMGVDAYDKDTLAYCLSKKVDGMVEILLSKTMCDEKEFKQEVETLAKYFNADVFLNDK